MATSTRGSRDVPFVISRLRTLSSATDVSVPLEEPTHEVSPADGRLASKKRPRSPILDEAETPKKLRSDRHQRVWTVCGSIYDSRHYYFLDPAEQVQNSNIVKAVVDGEFILLTGPWASGKSTRLFRLRELLEKKGYYCLYYPFGLMECSKDINAFWSSIGMGLQRSHTPFSVKISSPETFAEAFAKTHWDRPVVILIDSLTRMSLLPTNLKDSFLRTLHGVQHNKSESAIASVIGAGTFNIMRLTTTYISLSPFNISGAVQTPYFTIDETRQLFKAFQQDRDICIESAVVDDIWENSNGHPGMVCLVGKTVSDHLEFLLDGGRTVSFSKWLGYSTANLLDVVFAYNSFRRIVDSLSAETAQKAVRLYQTQFAGFLEDVEISMSDEVLADFLTSEGVLSRPVAHERKYRVTSPLIDALVRLRVISRQSRVAPSVPASIRLRLDIPFVLTESLKFFEKDLIESAYSCSFQSPKVLVNSSFHSQVPRESVYDTELMRILYNWLSKFGWSVTGRWHDGKHSIVLRRVHEEFKSINILEVLATRDPRYLKAHIEKIPEHMTLLSADAGWVIHFTCEDEFTPTWQTPDELSRGVNVIHVSHKEDFTNVTLHIYSKNVEKQKRDLCI